MEQNNSTYEAIPFLFASFPAARTNRNISLIDKTLLKMKDIIDESNALKIKRVPIFITSGERIIAWSGKSEAMSLVELFYKRLDFYPLPIASIPVQKGKTNAEKMMVFINTLIDKKLINYTLAQPIDSQIIYPNIYVCCDYNQKRFFEESAKLLFKDLANTINLMTEELSKGLIAKTILPRLGYWADMTEFKSISGLKNKHHNF